jgi:hypothetical protein
MFKLYAINTPGTVRFFYNVISGWIDEFTTAKISVLGDEFASDLHKTVDKSCLEHKYGGTLPDKTSNFFPPTF